jgi:hypothetical protein
MSKLEIAFEWVDPAGARGAELRATWARLQLSVDEPITRLLDHTSKTVRDAVFVPLYPLAEWLATNWWTLLYEPETPGRRADSSYAIRHSLQGAREGFALPPITIQPLGGSVRLGWQAVKLEHQQVEFIGAGTAYVDAAELAETLSDFIASVILRLDELGITDTLLHNEWSAVVSTEPEEREFCEAAGALGLDPYSLPAEIEEKILAIGEALPQQLSDEFFSAADFYRLAEQAEYLIQAIELSRTNSAQLENLLVLRNEVGRNAWRGRPWHQGYEFARELRRYLQLNGEIMQSMGDISRALGIEEQRLDSAIVTHLQTLSAFDAVVAENAAGSPGFVIGSPREEAMKFAFCRGLFEFLVSAPGEPLLITRTRSERQKRNRAFAAEFLVPADSLRARLRADSVGEEEIDDLAADFGVSPHVVIYQLQNHRIAQTLPDASLSI